MSASADVKYQLSLLRPSAGETTEHFAKRGYSMQMEVYSANCGYDLIDGEHNWHHLNKEDKRGWLDWAEKRVKGTAK